MSPDAGPVWRFSSLAVVVLLGALVAASPALSQSGRPPYDQAEIQRKVQKSVGLQRQALQALSDPKRAEVLPASYLDGVRRHIEQAVHLTSGLAF